MTHHTTTHHRATGHSLTTLEVRRDEDDEDDELVGLLLWAAAGWVPATVFRAALGPPTQEELAEAVVREQGLSSLADRWWARSAGAPWRTAWLLEVKADRLRLRWDDPILMQGGPGTWYLLADLEIQRHRPT